MGYKLAEFSSEAFEDIILSDYNPEVDPVDVLIFFRLLKHLGVGVEVEPLVTLRPLQLVVE